MMKLLMVILSIDLGQMKQIQECKPFVENLGTWTKNVTGVQTKEKDIIDLDTNWTFTPKEEKFFVEITTDDADPTVQKLQKFSDDKCKKSSGEVLSVPVDIQDWDYEKNICYVTREPKKLEYPYIRYCYNITDNRSCCKSLHDQEITEWADALIPKPCRMHYRFRKLLQFNCLACIPETNKIVLKAEATEDFVFVVNELLNVQNNNTGLQRRFNLTSKSSNKETVQGYVKVCSHWLSQFWREEYVSWDYMRVQDPKDALYNPTFIFDQCGFFDIYNDNKPHYKGYLFPAWQDALSFLEWTTIPLMPNWGIIIVDNMDTQANLPKKEYNSIREYFRNKYSNETKEEIEERLTDALRCFSGGVKSVNVAIWAMVLFAMAYVI